MAADPSDQPTRRSFRRDAPCPKITARLLVEHARVLWRAARKIGATDGVGYIIENESMATSERPRVMTMGTSTRRGLAAICATLLENALRGDGTDDPRMETAVKLLTDMVHHPNRPDAPPPALPPRRFEP